MAGRASLFMGAASSDYDRPSNRSLAAPNHLRSGALSIPLSRKTTVSPFLSRQATLENLLEVEPLELESDDDVPDMEEGPDVSRRSSCSSASSYPRKDQTILAGGVSFSESSLLADAGKKWIIQPRSLRKVKWDLFVGALILYSVVTIPFSIAFPTHMSYEEQKQTFVFVFDRIIDGLFIIDMILSFRTGYISKFDLVVVDPRKVAFHYLTSWFVIDFCSSVPFDIIAMEAMGNTVNSDHEGASNAAKARSLKIIRVVRLIRLTKLVRLFKLKKISSIMDEQQWINPHVVKLCGMLFKILFISHFLACIWRLIGTPPVESLCTGEIECDIGHPHITWIDFFRIDDLDTFDQYIAAFHMVTASMMAVGYGDLFATNTLERLYCIFVQVIGAVTFGFILSSVTGLIESSKARSNEVRKRMQNLAEWMQSRSVPAPLQKRVKDQIRYEMIHNSMYDMNELLNPVSSNLRAEITRLTCSERVDTLHRIFDSFVEINNQSNIWDPILLEIAVQLKPQYLDRNDVMYECNEPVEDIVFIKSGSVAGFQTPTTSFTVKVQDESSVLCFVLGGLQLMPGSLTFSGCPAFLTYCATTMTEFYSMPILTFQNEVSMRAEHTTEFLFSQLDREESRRAQMLADILAESDFERRDTSGGTGEMENDVGKKPTPMSLLSGRARTKTHILYNWVKYPIAEVPQNDAMRLSVDSISRSPSILAFERKKCRRLSHPRTSVIGDEQYSMLCEIVSYESSSEILKRYVIDPSMPKKIAWDCFVGTFILYSVIVIPYRIGLQDDAKGGWDIFDICVDILFFFDMLIQMRTAFVDNMGIIDSIPRNIMLHYLRTWFVIDFFSTMPIDRMVEALISSDVDASSDVRAVKLIRTLRLIRLLKLMRLLKIQKLNIEDTPLEQFIPPWCGPLLKLGLGLLFTAHLMGCGWFYIATSNAENDCKAGEILCSKDPQLQTWWQSKNIEPFDHTAQYVAALYWAFSTMTTVGYGDIVPMSTNSRIYAICSQILGATVFGYVIGSIAGIARQRFGAEQLIQSQLTYVSAFSEENQLPKALARSMLRGTRLHLEYRSPYREETFLSDLPNCLRKQCMMAIHANTISMFRIFRRRPNWLCCMILQCLDVCEVEAGSAMEEFDYCLVVSGCFEASPKLDTPTFIFTPGMMFGGEAEFLHRNDVTHFRACTKMLSYDESFCKVLIIRKSYIQALPLQPYLSSTITSIISTALADQYRRDLPGSCARSRMEYLRDFQTSLRYRVTRAYETKLRPATPCTVDVTTPKEAEHVPEIYPDKGETRTLQLEIPLQGERFASMSDRAQLELRIRALLQEVCPNDEGAQISFESRA